MRKQTKLALIIGDLAATLLLTTRGNNEGKIAVGNNNKNVLMQSTRSIALSDETYNINADDLSVFGDDLPGLCYAKDTSTGNHGYIDANGNWVIPANYKTIGYFGDGLAAAQDAATQKYGYINANGEWIIQPQYDSATYFSEGYAVVDGLTVIDTTGKIILDCSH